jgi:hypothetical protein
VDREGAVGEGILQGEGAVLLGDEDVGDANVVAVVEAEDAFVEGAVVQLAEGDAAGHVVRAAVGAVVVGRGR